MMSTHGLYCTVCMETFESRESWILHLLTESHQSPAREACLRWGRKERKCTIVVFSDKPVVEADSLLEYFSMRDLYTIVTDFVWWPDRPRIGLMQFESREKVNEVLLGLGKRVLQLPDCCVQFKKASSYLDWEWSELICKGAGFNEFQEETQDSRNEDRKTKLLKNRYVLEDDRRIGISAEQTINAQVPEQSEKQKYQEMVVNSKDNDNCNGLVNEAAPCSPLASEFRDLCKSIEIPDAEYLQFKDIMGRVRKITGRSEYKVSMYRNWILKLRHPGNNILLLHITRKKRNRVKDDTDNESFLEVDNALEKKLLDVISLRDNLPEFQKQDSSHCAKYKLRSLFTCRQVPNVPFSMTSDRSRNVEVQLDRILEYFYNFYPSVKPFLSLVYIWAKANDILLADRLSLKHANSATVLPNPTALNWLVILFLSKVGIIPTVREILDRILSFEDDFDPESIRFKADVNFTEDWKNRNQNAKLEEPEQFILNVLRLLQDFFQLFHETWSDERKIILNPNDGEIYGRDDLYSGRCESKLSRDDILKLRRRIAAATPRRMAKIYMIHPLCITWSLSVGNKNIKKHAEIARKTASRMKKFLKRYSKAKLLQEGQQELEKALVGRQGMIRRGKQIISKKRAPKKSNPEQRSGGMEKKSKSKALTKPKPTKTKAIISPNEKLRKMKQKHKKKRQAQASKKEKTL